MAQRGTKRGNARVQLVDTALDLFDRHGFHAVGIDRILAEAETSPNYQKLLDRGDARNVGDLCAAGDEDEILRQFRRYADAGVTDLSVRLLPIGDTRDELVASKYRTREVIGELASQVR